MIINEARVKKQLTQEEKDVEVLFKPKVLQHDKVLTDLESIINQNIAFITFIKNDGSFRSGMFTRNKLVLDAIKENQIGQGENFWIPAYTPLAPLPMFDVSLCIVEKFGYDKNYIESSWRSMSHLALSYGYYAIIGLIDPFEFIEEYKNVKTINDANDLVENFESDLMSKISKPNLDRALNQRRDLCVYIKRNKTSNPLGYTIQDLKIGPYFAK